MEPDSRQALRTDVLALIERQRASRRQIPIVAYFKSERREFYTAGELDDWLSAAQKKEAAVR